MKAKSHSFSIIENFRCSNAKRFEECDTINYVSISLRGGDHQLVSSDRWYDSNAEKYFLF